MSRLHPIPVAVSVLSVSTLLLALGACGDGTPSNMARPGLSERELWHRASNRYLEGEEEKHEAMRQRNAARASAAGVEPGAAIDLYEPFGIPLGPDGELGDWPKAIKWGQLLKAQAGSWSWGIVDYPRPPIPSSYFHGIRYHMDSRQRLTAIDAASEPTERNRCFDRLEQILRYWTRSYPGETLFFNPKGEQELFYSVQMWDGHGTDAYVSCERERYQETYVLSLGFVYSKDIDRDFNEEMQGDLVATTLTEAVTRLDRARSAPTPNPRQPRQSTAAKAPRRTAWLAE